MSKKHYILVGRTSEAIASGILGEFGQNPNLTITAPTNVIQSRFGTFGDGESIFELFVDGKLPDHPIEQNLSEAEKKEIEKDLKGAHITIVHSISGDNTSSRATSLLDGVYDLKDAYGVGSITVIAPHLPFMRNDRRFRKVNSNGEEISQRNAISGRNYARRLKQEGADTVVGFDPHSRDGVKHYRDYFTAANSHFISIADFVAANFARDHDVVDPSGDWMVACGSPDGLNKASDFGIARAKKVGISLYKGTAFDGVTMKNAVEDIPYMFGIAKERINDKETRIIDFSGNVAGKTGLLVDDIYSSGGTTIQGAQRLREEGASACFAYATHGVLTGNAIEKLLNEPSIDSVMLTDSIPGAVEKLQRAGVMHVGSKFKVISLAEPVVAEINKDHAAYPKHVWPVKRL
ncbi:MAG TPA: hypothetical protein PLF01_02715 [Alphaproteobacteria bacterium]|nr:hypothetical protein [Alphaproteobacteria bacterium]